jgi:hypothetical protein
MNTCSNNQVVIIRGEDRTFTVRLLQENTSEPFDLTDNAEITARFITDTGTLDATITNGKISILGDPTAGLIEISLNETDTLSLLIDDSASIEIKIENGSLPDYDTRKVKLNKVLNIQNTIF